MSFKSSVKLFLVVAVAVILCSTLAESASVQNHHSHHHQQRIARSSDKDTVSPRFVYSPITHT